MPCKLRTKPRRSCTWTIGTGRWGVCGTRRCAPQGINHPPDPPGPHSLCPCVTKLTCPPCNTRPTPSSPHGSPGRSREGGPDADGAVRRGPHRVHLQQHLLLQSQGGCIAHTFIARLPGPLALLHLVGCATTHTHTHTHGQFVARLPAPLARLHLVRCVPSFACLA